MIKAVLFDMDGTLIDTEKYYRECWPLALSACGYESTPEMALQLRSLGRPFAPALMKSWFGQDYDYYAVREKRKEIMEGIIKERGIQIRPGAEELLSCLKERGIMTAITTATDPERTHRYMKLAGLSETWFDRILSATMVEKGKPAPDVYLFACRELGLEPENCAAVEDAPNGVLSAYRAGCKVIMVPEATQPDEALSACLTAKADSLDQIIPLLEML